MKQQSFFFYQLTVDLNDMHCIPHIYTGKIVKETPVNYVCDVDGLLHCFRFTTEDNEERVRKGFAHMFYCKTHQINKYLETLEEINEILSNLSK